MSSVPIIASFEPGPLAQAKGSLEVSVVILGNMPRIGMDFIGTKVAFTRIPDLAEFCE